MIGSWRYDHHDDQLAMCLRNPLLSTTFDYNAIYHYITLGLHYTQQLMSLTKTAYCGEESVEQCDIRCLAQGALCVSRGWMI